MVQNACNKCVKNLHCDYGEHLHTQAHNADDNQNFSPVFALQPFLAARGGVVSANPTYKAWPGVVRGRVRINLSACLSSHQANTVHIGLAGIPLL